MTKFEIVTPAKTYGPIETRKEIPDWVESLGLCPEDQDQEGGWFIQVIGATPDDAVSTVYGNSGD